MKKKNIAIIPARSGSKGVKDKNIRLLNGKPLIAYTIEEALKSEVFDVVMVSTDSESYAEIAAKYGAEVPHLRPYQLSTDEATTIDVVNYVLASYRRKDRHFDNICVLQPTSPLRTAKHIKESYSLYNAKNAKAVVSVCECEHSPLWAGTLDKTLSMTDFIKDGVEEVPRQRLGVYYRQNGAIYWANNIFLLRNKRFITSDTLAYIMDRKSSIDIDSIEDFEFVEYIFSK